MNFRPWQVLVSFGKTINPYIIAYMQWRLFPGRSNGKNKTKKYHHMPPSTLLVLCMKIQRGLCPPLPPAADAHKTSILSTVINHTFFKLWECCKELIHHNNFTAKTVKRAFSSLALAEMQNYFSEKNANKNKIVG